MNEITDEKLRKMKLQVLQEMEPEERKHVYSLIRRRSTLLTSELENMKAAGDRPTVSYIKKSYNLSGKAIHLQIQKVFGTDYANIEPTLTARKKNIGQIPLQTESTTPPTTFEDLKKRLKAGSSRTWALLEDVVSGKRTSKHIDKEEAKALLARRASK